MCTQEVLYIQIKSNKTHILASNGNSHSSFVFIVVSQLWVMRTKQDKTTLKIHLDEVITSVVF